VIQAAAGFICWSSTLLQCLAAHMHDWHGGGAAAVQHKEMPQALGACLPTGKHTASIGIFSLHRLLVTIPLLWLP